MKTWKILSILIGVIFMIILAQAIKPAQVTVRRTWTAPTDWKDDSTTQAAASYDLRYSTQPITDANFGAATQVIGEPIPKAPGQPETCLVTVQDNTHYWFAIKSQDIAGNVSPISNIYDEITPDKTGPTAITDLK